MPDGKGDETDTDGTDLDSQAVDTSHVDEWKDRTKGIDRVIAVALTLDQPRTAKWVAEAAHVSEATARDHLNRLVELHALTKSKAHGTTTYSPNEAYIRFRDISGMAREHDKDELEKMIVGIQEEIESRKKQYEVESPQKLRTEATSEGTGPEKAREYLRVASEWETNRYDLSIVREALERYEKYSERPTTAQA